MTHNNPSKFISATDVRARYGGLGPVTLHRWMAHPTMGFPAPVKIGSRNFWALSDLEAWEASRPVRQAAKQEGCAA